MMITKVALIQSLSLLKPLSPSAQLDAEVLLSHALQRPKEFLYAYPEYELTQEQQKRYEGYIARRLQREPVAYIINKKEFYGYEFYVDRRVLIPRPETEALVDKTLQYLKSKANPESFLGQRSKVLTIDIGTGSGCLIVTIIKELLKHNPSLHAYSFIATDISPNALEVAKANAHAHGVENYITFLKGDLLPPITTDTSFANSDAMIIVANLPYITKQQYKTLQPEIVNYEPPQALVTERNDPYYLYHALDSQINRAKQKHGSHIHTIYEIPWSTHYVYFSPYGHKVQPRMHIL